MNIFYLDEDVTKCAEAHVDKHVIKMVLEYAQLLSAAHHIHDSSSKSSVYKLTHSNHPSTRWTALAGDNYDYLYRLFKATNLEYGHRYGKWHDSWLKLSQPLSRNPCKRKGGWAEPTPAMDDSYKVAGDSIASYRNYYNKAKRHLHSWTKREAPSWITQQEAPNV